LLMVSSPGEGSSSGSTVRARTVTISAFWGIYQAIGA
jgi:hypothetical protein